MIEVVALGGLGQFGMNMMVFTADGTRIVVDAGVAFPDAQLPGVDLVIPAFDYLESGPKPCAVVLTHGHEDHIGAVPYLLKLIDGPIVGTPLTVAMALAKAAERNVTPSHPPVLLSAGSTLRVGAFDVEFIGVNHSIPGSVAVAIHSADGVLVHTGDFKVDPTPPDGAEFGLNRLAELGREGVLALFSDNTNADRPGFTGSEKSVIGPLSALFAETVGTLVVATFSTSIHRIQILADLCARFDRRLAFLGRSMLRTVEIASRVGCLRIAPGVAIPERAISSHPPQNVACIATGSQGQPVAALHRMARGEHRHVSLTGDDTVVLSARVIPGNEKLVHRMENEFCRRGVRLVAGEVAGVHVSGHGSQEELRLMMSLLRPRYFIPIHGDDLQIGRHAALARQAGFEVNVLLAENGDKIVFDGGQASIVGATSVGRVYIDGARTGRVIDEVLHDRLNLARDGVLVAVVTISKSHGLPDGAPELVGRGVLSCEMTREFMDRSAIQLDRVLREFVGDRRADPGVVKELIASELQRLVHAEGSRRPVIIPVVLET